MVSDKKDRTDQHIYLLDFNKSEFWYVCYITNSRHNYTDHAGLETSLDLSNASPISRQIAIDKGGPTSALESMSFS